MCDKCKHIQLPFVFNDGYYDNYSLPFLEFNNNYLLLEERKRQIALLQKYKTDGLLIEIGCNEGYFLELARETFKDILGVEPAKDACEILAKKNIPYVNDYFSCKALGNKRCDFFYCANVFEHLSDPLSVLKEIYDACNEGAVGLLEVPDGQKIWENRSFGDVILEHINYFSAISLMLLSSRAGFLVENYNASDGRRIEILLKKPQANIAANFSEKKNEIISFVSDLPRDKKIAAWGAGQIATSIMPLIETKISISNWYDINPSVHGKYIAGCKTAITLPSEESVKSNDYILLFGTRYDAEITADLRNKYGYLGEIITLR